jgi:hypothetical protein
MSFYSADRWYKDAKGVQKPRKVFYYFPLHAYVNNLYSQEDLIQHLWLDCMEHAEGHITKSRGWRAKVTNNPHMSNDHRNLGLDGCTDGVPFFKDGQRGGWPFILRSPQLPEGMSGNMKNCHVAFVQANEYRSKHDNGRRGVKRVIRSPKSFVPALTVLVDDLYHAYHKGVKTMDVSKKEIFFCKVMLMLVDGDYKAQATVSGFSHQGFAACHFCKDTHTKDKAIQREIVGGYRRWLGNNVDIDVMMSACMATLMLTA